MLLCSPKTKGRQGVVKGGFFTPNLSLQSHHHLERPSSSFGWILYDSQGIALLSQEPGDSQSKGRVGTARTMSCPSTSTTNPPARSSSPRAHTKAPKEVKQRCFSKRKSSASPVVAICCLPLAPRLTSAEQNSGEEIFLQVNIRLCSSPNSFYCRLQRSQILPQCPLRLFHSRQGSSGTLKGSGSCWDR